MSNRRTLVEGSNKRTKDSKKAQQNDLVRRIFGKKSQTLKRTHKPKKKVFSTSATKNASFSGTPYETRMQHDLDYLYELDRESNKVEHTIPSSRHQQISAMLLASKEEKQIFVMLTWPSVLSWPELGHVIACQTIARETLESSGMRIAVYPARDNARSFYRDTCVEASALLNRAQTVIDANGTGALTSREMAYLVLNIYDRTEGKQPVVPVGDILPRFDWSRNEGLWKRRGGITFNKLKHDLWGMGSEYSRRETLTSFIEQNDAPQIARDGVFRISAGTPPGEAMKVIHTIPDLDCVMLEVSRRAGQQINNWANHSAKKAKKLLANNVSSIIFTDCPIQYRVILKELHKQEKKKKRRDADSVKIRTLEHIVQNQHPLQQSVDNGQSFTPSRETDHVFFVSVTGMKALNHIAEIVISAKMVRDESPEFSHALYKIAGFLRVIADSPIPQDTARSWAIEKTEGWNSLDRERYMARHCWVQYKQSISSEIEELGYFGRDVTSRVLKLGDKVAEDCKTSTVIGILLQETVAEFQAENKKTLVLTPYRPHKALLHDQLNCGDDGLVTICSVDEIINFIEYECVVFAGGIDRSLPVILLSQNLPEECHLFVSGYNAERISKTLESLISIEGFKEIHERASTIRTDLEEEIQGIKSIGNLWLEQTYNFEYSGATHFDTDPYAIIHLEGVGGVPVGKNTTLLKEHATGDKSSTFKLSTVDDLNESLDRLLLLDDDMVDRIEGELGEEWTKQIQNPKSVVVSFARMAQEKIEGMFSEKHLSKSSKTATLLEKMQEIDPEVGGRISHNSVQNWINHVELINGIGVAAETSGQAQTKDKFILFCRALDIPEHLAKTYFMHGIRHLRSERIQQGRKTHGIIKSLLTGKLRPENAGLSKDVHDALTKEAQAHLRRIVSIDYVETEY